jgi:hypothetical protein
MKNKKFPCTQSELFLVCKTGWNHCKINLEKFSAFRPVYTAAYVESRLEDIDAVSEMSLANKRNASQEMARTKLKQTVGECHDEWKKLKLAVPSIWQESDHEAQYKDMGQTYYYESLKYKWESTASLMDSTVAFISEREELIKASPMLGAAFIEGFKLLRKKLNADLNTYISHQQNQGKSAAEVLDACNKLYKDLMQMFADGRIIFKGNDSLLRGFIFDKQLFLVSGQSVAGIKGSITNGSLPVSQIPDLLVTLLENGDEAYIGEDGSYRFSQLAAGLYTMQVSATGYQPQTIPALEVNTGAFTIRNLTLVP